MVQPVCRLHIRQPVSIVSQWETYVFKLTQTTKHTQLNYAVHHILAYIARVGLVRVRVGLEIGLG
jgi:hypothetical protein